ncbi:hypothetical protein [Micromonospora sp. LH3U1]|uniref:hypothetical protein n=1 Tax=Micromonospora sp. LH3U1 TaxID=3018339 RepID=UPI0023491A6C|nr:hypothetical protein [Micromonospora sp. LH3U1]WCN81795.1 hypothetical protein PCA76_01445 [Micromonospora sp. LH3U1]
MEASELARVDLTLRRLCADHGLTWVVEAVDAAVAEGAADSVTEGSSSHGQRRGGRLFGYGIRPDERSRIEPEIRWRPYTDTERVLLLLDAMLAIYRDLPSLRTETVRVLTDGFQGRVAVPEQIITALDEDNEEAVILWQPDLEADTQGRQRVVGTLIALRAAVVPG